MTARGVAGRPSAGGATRGLLQIGDVAERTGLSLRTVRHYEEVGLLPPADRSPGGFRLYDDAALDRLFVIKAMKPLEFSLEQMRELLDVLDELRTRPARLRSRELEEAVARYGLLVSERIAKLRERLTGAEQLQDALA
ncbi:MAG: MerR family transcriptional regulator [Mycobacteriales bacterium]